MVRNPPNQLAKPLQGTKQTPSKSRQTPNGKAKGKANGSILSFFKKAQASSQQDNDDSLFLSDDESAETTNAPARAKLDGDQDDLKLEKEESRYNESNAPVKRKRTSVEDATMKESETRADNSQGEEDQTITPLRELDITSHQKPKGQLFARQLDRKDSDFGLTEANTPNRDASCSPFKKSAPTLKREQTSISEDLFDGIEDFADDEFPEDGEEFTERFYLQEQRRLEREFDDEGDETNLNDDSFVAPQEQDTSGGATDCSCPICNASLEGLSTEQASLHVNRCLDGDPLPVSRPAPKPEPAPDLSIETEPEAKPMHKRFQAATIPRPPQESPFSLGGQANGKSAFSQIMSSHAEDQAWSTAAANEVAARGKPAFKRTCPFYKILPGFFTCVDAFRYGAVEGCNAYFLSHFHSDHYIGLTSSWCHGPIYCSHVTANLVRQQLRVDPKFVVDLEFEQKKEIPGTQGVHVTMIPANHCPGSSLYLFERVVGKGNTPKMQRVLHCGDFRACPAHVQHPLLRPDVIDAISGNKRQQKLDVCYLDTTYLTPKYAFPSQEQVIKACADMCVSLSKEKVDETDSWETTKKERAGSGMVKFVRTTTSKGQEEENIGDIVSQAKIEGKRRGRLLVIVGTYSIGKERICLGVAKALDSKIFAPPGKQKICRALEDPELNSRLTDNPLEAQVHMQMLMEIRAETLADYLTGYKPHFSRIVGFRPSGWNYRPPNSRFLESPSVQTVLHSDNWKTKYSMAELVPQRGSTREASCFGVPYSEHSSFRELSMFCCALRIDKIIPTVNVGSAKSREKMKLWIEKWAMEKKKNGLYRIEDGTDAWS